MNRESHDMTIRIIKHLIVISVVLALGLRFGVVFNFAWYFFHAVCLGWGDSAPDWYVNIQHQIQSIVPIIGSVLSACIVEFIYIRYERRKLMKASNNTK